MDLWIFELIYLAGTVSATADFARTKLKNNEIPENHVRERQNKFVT
jgi:hypothetical protein